MNQAEAAFNTHGCALLENDSVWLELKSTKQFMAG